MRGFKGVEGFPEAATTQGHGGFIIVILNSLGNRMGLGDAFHQGRRGNPVAAQANQLRLHIAGGIEQHFNCGMA